MADINGVTLNAGSEPTVKYTITYTKSRPNNSQMTYNFTISCALNSSGSYINAGYALLCTMTVNGSSSQVRIKANDGDNWSGTTPRLKYVSVTCSSSTANALQGVTFKVVSDGRMPISSGVITNSSYTVTSSPLLITNPVRGTVTVAPSIFETATISWSGFKNGTNNAIKNYEVWYQQSTDNINWGSRVSLAGGLSTSVSSYTWSGGVRGQYYRFNVVALGTVSNTYSDTNTYTSAIRKNKPPIMPSIVTARPENYSTEYVTISWSGASGGTSPIKGYMVAVRTSQDKSTWTSWNILHTFNLSASSGTFDDINPPRTAGIYVQYGVWTIDTLSIYSGEGVSNIIQSNVTPCTPPTVFSVSLDIAETNVTLSWSGASGGGGNMVTGYIIEYADSSDGVSFGVWEQLTQISSSQTNGTFITTPPDTRGYFRKFRIRTTGIAGEAYYSPWKETENTVEKNVLPTPPTQFDVSPLVYTTPTVTLSWSGTVAGTSEIKNYIIQQSTSSDNEIFSTWSAVATVQTSSTSGSVSVTPSNTANIYTRYRIAVTDALDALSSYVISETIRKNQEPLKPILHSPQNRGTTYNKKPMFLIEVKPEPDGENQKIFVLVPNGTWLNNIDNPEYFSKNIQTPNGQKTIFTCPELEAGEYSVTIEVRDDYSSSESVTRSFTVLEYPFEDITANVTHVKASHMTKLRQVINNIHDYYDLPRYKWKDEIIGGVTPIRDWSFHILELRASVDAVVSYLNKFDDVTFFDIPTFIWIALTNGRPKADVMEQIMGLVTSL